uniref:HECT-type E3 ubiquitin transferase n=1 Tax=Palpitomonas bilix TaxID=652834 RepID=A0A7S3GFX7_9EUKA|mmetsp:Transcript_47654/g.123570  ORF Transcript_47654/g.123570 Transcript_47654/m.123570 type:complete len:384 (+) Transcript_47654:736-1887(+)
MGEGLLTTLCDRQPHYFRAMWVVEIAGEPGCDEGGVQRELMESVLQALFSSFVRRIPDEIGLDEGESRTYSSVLDGLECTEPLFMVPVGEAVDVLHINPKATGKRELQLLKLCGTMCARVVISGVYRSDHSPVPFRLARSMFSNILGVGVSFASLESDMPSMYDGRVQLLDVPIAELGLDGLSFTETNVVLTNRGEVEMHEDVEVVHGGRNMELSDENKVAFLNLFAKFLLVDRCQEGLAAFTEGFCEVFPREHFYIISESDMELLVCGTSSFDVEDFEQNVEWTVPRHMISWFCNTLRRFSPEQKSRFLQFVTGSSRLPAQGFRGYSPHRIKIRQVPRPADRLPTSHTCFNTLDVPLYRDEATLQHKLLVAISVGYEGFGLE